MAGDCVERQMDGQSRPGLDGSVKGRDGRLLDECTRMDAGREGQKKGQRQDGECKRQNEESDCSMDG